VQISLALGLGMLGVRRSTGSPLPLVVAILYFVEAGFEILSAAGRHGPHELDTLLQAFYYLWTLVAMASAILTGLLLMLNRTLRAVAPRWALMSAAGALFAGAFLTAIRQLLALAGAFGALSTLGWLSPLVHLPATVGVGAIFVLLALRRSTGPSMATA
jgi:hypothetical protein